MRFVGLLLFFLQSFVFAATVAEQKAIAKRIAPIGQVQIEEKLKIDTVKSNAGQTIYEQHCTVCHQTGLAGAPKFHDKNDWQPRVDKETIDGLVAVALKGINAMPAKGTCNECSDNDLKQAILYMVPSL